MPKRGGLVGLDSYRLSRRRALAAAGMASAAAMVTWACGGSSDEKAKSNIYKPVDSSKQATKGGIFTSFLTGEIPGLDALSGAQWVGNHANAAFVYSRLAKFKLGQGARATGEVEGDLATGWEVAPDGLQYTFKLQPNALWDSRPPTSSRPVDAEDVVFSWKKWSTDATNRTDLANINGQGGPVLSVSATDKSTVVFKLANQDATVLPLLANADSLWIMPREADGRFDPRRESRGSSAWIQTDYTPSIGLKYRRNPNWFGKESGLPYLDGYDVPIIPEYSARMAQFRTGNLQADTAVLQQDILQVKKDLPDFQMYDNGIPLSWIRIKLGWPKDGKGLNGIPNPYLDERVRRAMSMAIDRNTFIDVFNDIQKYEEAGFPKEKRWSSHISAAWEGYWIDPTNSKEFGPNAQYFQFNLAESKKMLAAAGFPNGLETTFTQWANNYTPGYPEQTDVMAQMVSEGGFKLKRNPADYATALIPIYSLTNDFEGVVYGSQSATVDPAVFLPFQYNSAGGRTVMNKGMDNFVESETAAIRQEIDINKRKQRIQEFQRYMAGKMWVVPAPGVASNFAISPPWIGNVGYFNEWIAGAAPPIGSGLRLWIDNAKMKK